MYTVADVMTRELVTLGEEDDLSLADSLLALGRIRHLPVTREGRFVGLVTHRDILRAVAKGAGEQILAGSVMTRRLRTVTPDTRLVTAARLMLRHKLGCLPVVEDDRLVGLVTEADLVRFAADLAEELDEGQQALEGLDPAGAVTPEP